MRTPLRRAAGLLLLLVSSLPASASATSLRVRVPKAGPPAGLATSIAGVVVDEREQPVAGAEIEAVASNPRWDPQRQQARTDAAGRFLIPEIEEGRPCTLRVSRPGFAPTVLSLAPYGTLELRLVLHPGATAAGRVVDENGHPVQGARVELGRYRSTSGADGRFEIPDLPDERFDLRVSHRDHPVLRQENVTASQGSRRIELGRLELPKGRRLTGQVLDPQGRPLAGVPVWAMDATVPSFADADGDPGLAPSAVTGPDGRFELAGVAPIVFVDVRASGYKAVRTLDLPSTPPRKIVLDPALPSLRTPSSDVVLLRGVTISGRVFAPDGSPAAGTRIYAGQDGRAPETRSDAAGRYRLTGVQPGTRELRAEHPELGEARRRLLAKPGAHRLDLTLDGQRERAVSGRVTGPGGEPLAGVQVEASDLTTYTHQDGSFRLVFPRGTLLFYRGDTPLRFARDGFATAVRSIQVLETPIEGLEIHLAKGWPLTGALLGLEPERASNARVEAARQDGEIRQGRVDRDGAYRIEDLEPGIWTVTAEVAWRQRARGTVEIVEGGASLDLKIPVLQQISGRLLDPEGKPIAGPVKLTGEDGSSEQATSQEDGTFSLQMAEGTYHIEGSGGSWAWTVLEEPVAVGDRPVEGLEIRLRAGAVLQGRVLGLPDGARALILFDPDHHSSWPTLTEPDGTYRVSDLTPGDWQVEVTVGMEDVRRIWRSRVTFAPGETEKILDLDPSLGSLTLSGRLESGAEPLSTHVTLLTPDGQPLMDDLLIEDAEGGAFQIAALRPGSYVLRIADYYRDRVVLKPVELSSDRTVTIDLLNP